MSEKYTRKLDFYTDGAFSSRSEMGGWSCVCVEDGNIILSETGCEPYSTNNRMELMGFLCALSHINTIVSRNTDVTITVDSAYIYNCIKDRWYLRGMENGGRTADKQEVKNQDLGKTIVSLYIKNAARLRSLTINKIKSHKKGEENSKGNEYADLLAVKARKELEL